MVYIPYDMKKGGALDREKTHSFDHPRLGVALDGGMGEDMAEKCEFLLNLDISDVLKTRKAQTSVTSSFSGTFHGMFKEPFENRIVIHCGKNLYSVKSDGSVTTHSMSLPNEKSLFAHFLGSLYIYSYGHVFRLNSDFSVTECEPYAPLVYKDISPTVATVDSIDRTVPLNLVSTRVSARFTATTLKYVKLPISGDETRGAEVFVDGVKVDPSRVTMTETRVTVADGDDLSASHVFTVSFYAKFASQIGYDYRLFDCTLAQSFGGAAGGESRLFFSGDDNFKGRYYVSELQDPTRVMADSLEILGDGCESITAMTKMYGSMMLFTPKSVYRMSYNASSEPHFSIKAISNEVGCDCPDTVCLVDNRIVFCNSKNGLFIIDSMDEKGENNIKPLSGNILRGQNAGLLERTESELVGAKGVDFDRKYYLFAGNYAYIWDYDKTSFVSSYSYSKSQGRLCFTVYNGINGGYGYDFGGKLYLFSPSGKKLYSFSTSSSGVSYKYRTAKTDFGLENSKKFVSELEIVGSCANASGFTLALYGDGVKFYEKNVNMCDGVCRARIALPKKELFDFAIEISGTGEIEISALMARFLPISR